MYPPPTGQTLTEEQARELDDTFLASDPFDYFRSRIASLLTWQESAPTADMPLPQAKPGTIRAQFNNYLQRPAADAPFRELDVNAQVAADAFAVRHHAAEALVRLACARLAPQPLGGARCLWAEIACGPHQIPDAIKRLRTSTQEQDDASERWLQALVPTHQVEAARSNPEIVDACNVFLDWLSYAITLLSPAEIDLQAGHNKTKHGLAVRARSDLKLTFTTTPPNDDGTIALSALTSGDAVDIFDQPVLELLARGPKIGGHPQGLEVTQLRLNPAALLAEAHMLAMAHAAFFHVAAAEHFAGRDLRDNQGTPPYPGYPIGGPRPAHIDSSAPLGMRFPLATPPGGGPVEREAGIGFRDGFQVIHVDNANRARARVV